MKSDKRYAQLMLKLSSLMMIAMGLFALYNAAYAVSEALYQESKIGTIQAVRQLVVFSLPPLMRAWAMLSTGWWSWRKQISTIFGRSLAYALMVPAGISLVVSLYERLSGATAIGVHLGTLCNILAIFGIRILTWYRRLEWVRLYRSRWQDYSGYAQDYGYVRTAYAAARNRAPIKKKRALRE